MKRIKIKRRNYASKKYAVVKRDKEFGYRIIRERLPEAARRILEERDKWGPDEWQAYREQHMIDPNLLTEDLWRSDSDNESSNN